jgi:hypothetical protein
MEKGERFAVPGTREEPIGVAVPIGARLGPGTARLSGFIKSTRGHICKDNRHNELRPIFWAYQFVLNIRDKKTVFSVILIV